MVLEERLDTFDLRGAQVHPPGNARLAKRLRKQGILTFLELEGGGGDEQPGGWALAAGGSTRLRHHR